MTKNWNIAGLITLVLILNACSSNVILSEAATEDFRTDGQRSEWAGKFQIPDGENFALGVSHDRNYLYIAVSSIDRDFQRQLAMGGLILWLDAKGGKRQNLGLNFEGKMPRGKRQDVYQRGQNNAGDSQDRDTRLSPSNIFNGDLTLIVIDTKAGKSLGPADLLATANSIDETLFIEYQIPLTLLGEEFDMQKLGLGLESTSERSGRSSGSGGHPGGMSAGGRGGRPGGMEGGQRGAGQQTGGPSGAGMGQNDLEVWLKVQLSPE